MTFALVFLFVLSAVLEAESLLSGNCNQPLGIADGKITDERMSASSAYNDDFATNGAHRGRLKLASWPPGYRASPSHIIGNNTPWIQIDFQKEMAVTGIATQGYGDSSVQEWVETYKVKYESSGRLLEVKKVFTGNTDSHSVPRHDFPTPLETSRIILLPQTWNNNFALRMELYGCEPKYNFTVKLLVRNIAFTFEVANTSSSQHHSLKTNATNEIRGMLNGSSGFTWADFKRFGPYTLPLQVPQAHSSVIVEMNIQHRKNYMAVLLDKLKNEVETGKTMFDRRVVETHVPFNYTCPPPTVSVNLNKAIDQAKVLLTTDKIGFQALVNHTSCSNSALSSASWEISRGPLRTKVFKPFMKRALTHKTPDFLVRQRYARASFFYISYVLRRPSDGRVMAFDYGYVLVLQAQAVVDLAGPARGIKGHGVVLLNATVSVDSHAGSSPTRFRFSWYCRRKDERFPEGGSRRVDIPNRRFRGSGGCYGYGPGQLSARNRPSLSVDLNKMEAGKTYVFRVVVQSSQYRPSSADHSITVLQPTNFSIRLHAEVDFPRYFHSNHMHGHNLELNTVTQLINGGRCTYNCGLKVAPNRRMIIQSECAGPLCQMITRYEWSMYNMNQSQDTHHWERVANLDERILSKPNSPNFVLAAVVKGGGHSLDPGTLYRIHVAAFVKAEKVKQGDILFVTNPPPHTDVPGGCQLTPREGLALSTDFLVNCSGWHDEDLPLTFSYSYKTANRIVTIKRGTQEPTLKTMLPQGERAYDYNITIQVEIIDGLGTASVDSSTVTVLPDNRLPSENTDNVIKRLNTSLEDSLKDNDVEQAATTALLFLTSVQQAKGPQNDNDLVKDAVLAQMANVEVNSFHEVGQLSSVVTLATDERKDMPITSLENTVELLTSMTNFIWAHVGGIPNYDKDAVQNVGGDILQGFSNAIVVSSSQAAKTKEQNRQIKEIDRKGNQRQKDNKGVNQARDLTQNTLLLIDKLGSALLSTKVLGEKPTSFTSDAITLMLDKQTPSEMASKTFRGQAKMDGEVVRLPSAEALFGNSISNLTSVDAQMLLLKENPYTWDPSSENISSSVIQFDLKTGNETILNISGLHEPLQLFLPIKTQTKGSNKTPKGHLFVKPNGSLQVHQMYLANDAERALVELRPQNSAIFEVFVSSGLRPTPEKHNFSRVIPDFSSCTRHGANLGYLNCTSNPYMFSFSSGLTGSTGLHFIGIRLLINFTESSPGKQPRRRRGVGSSCADGNGRREKRSCVGVKEPPTTPPPTPILIIPKYNGSTDVNYTMSVTLTSCLYWSEKKQAWTSEGCQVGPKTNSSRLHCLCTHLSAFGGNIFVAPNPIDFDRVWKEFGRLRETKNYVVIFTVCSIFGLYFIGVTFARRADKKDRQKVVANVLMTDGDTDGYKYNVSIQTGMWSGFGTTAKVGIFITGEQGHSGVISLSCLGTTRKLFARASVNNFTLSLPKSLGKLTSVDVWHDNSGRHPAWFLQQIVVTDEQTEETWFFFVNQWLAVDKGAGEIEISVKVAEGRDLTAFKPLFISRAARRLGEGHIWISVFSKPPHNPFTRCQRLSCCLSFLFTAMVTNAMFYQFGREATDTFKFGPLVMSWTQIKIGIQSSIIAIPVNVLVVLIFRNIKQSSSPDIYDARDKSAASGCLPHFFVYIGWLLCLLVSLTGAFFTVLYSLQWGVVISNEWLTSILVSLVQDVLVLQPIKVIAFATLLSLVIKKPPEQDTVIGPSFFNHDSTKSRVKRSVLRGEKLLTIRQHSVKLRKAFEAAKEIVSFLVFGFLLLVICYGDQDPARYHVTNSLSDIFGDFEEVVDTPSLWNWINEVLIPGLYDVTWYNGRPFEYDEGFISSREGMMLGMPRLRQIRIRARQKCPADILDLHLGRAFSRCLPAYSSSEEDKTPFNLPRWVSLTNYSDPRFPIELCPKPWRYVTKQVTQSLSHQGVTETFDGGGYVADLGYNDQSAMEVTGDLRAHDWIDDLTAAVFIEFTVFNPSSSLFSVVRGVYERLRTGAAVALVDVKTFALYPSSNVRFQSFYEVCQLLFLIVIVVCFVVEMVKFIREKRYLHQLWNWVELALLVVSLVAVVMSFLKGKYISIFVKDVQRNPYATVSSDYVVRWSNQQMLWLSLAIFILTLKLLRLIRFNPHICQMQATLKRSVRPVLSFSLVFAIAVVAFSFFGFVGFGSQVAVFSSLYQSFRTNLLMSIGKQIDYVEIHEFNSTLQMIYFFCYFLFILAVLVNIFIAVLVDSYADVRTEQEEGFADAKLGDFMFGQVVEKIRQFPGKFVTSVKNALCSKSVQENYKPNLKFGRRRKKRAVPKVERKTLKLSSGVFSEVRDETIARQELVPLKLPDDSSKKPGDEYWRTEAEKTLQLAELFEAYYLIQARKCLAEIATELRRGIR